MCGNSRWARSSRNSGWPTPSTVSSTSSRKRASCIWRPPTSRPPGRKGWTPTNCCTRGRWTPSTSETNSCPDCRRMSSSILSGKARSRCWSSRWAPRTSPKVTWYACVNSRKNWVCRTGDCTVISLCPITTILRTVAPASRPLSSTTRSRCSSTSTARGS